jgi:serine/threonine protein kinase/tetratricopeptide (TPR) repeat protein
MAKALTIFSLGPYEVEARIGSGGMGVVYRGRHRLTGKPAALKTVHVALPEQIAAFRREVQVLAELEHPGIVRIIEQGLSSGTPWYAMELVEGRPLSALLRGPLASETEVVLGSSQRGTAPLTEDLRPRRPGAAAAPQSGERYRDRPPLTELLGIVRQVCKALGFLHAHGLVHRDLKPDNILIQPDGNPVLVDFGIVGHFGDKAGREVLKLTRSAGTLAYMAPEQAMGRLVDARADLFSLGCILYECIVDELPFGPSGLYDPSLPSPPVPSNRVDGVSPELDRLVMGLLAKDVRERVGYAEDVAAALDRLGGEARPDSSPHSEVAYLYRPEFAGRQATLERLSVLIERARQGEGAMALVTGESGLGKTRLVLELGARAVGASMTVLTGECTPVGAQRLDASVRGEPLHPFRNFLMAVADACRAGSESVRARLLGRHGQVLAAYEPALSSVLSSDERHLEGLPAERARARMFAALDDMLEAFAADRPLLLLIDDLQWADSLSLEFLALRASRPSRRSRVSLIATCRSEEMNDELVAWSTHPSVTTERLGRFDRESVGQMVSGMLAVAAPPSEWVAFLEQESGGNPFFIAEYLRAAIAERLLTRTHNGRWLLGEVEGSSNLRERLGLPSSIAELVGRRLRGLDHGALQAVHAAAILGREFDLELLALTAALDLGQLTAAYTDLRRRQILQGEAAGGIGFVHDKLREIAYDLVDDAQRGLLHRRAAAALEDRFAGNPAALDAGKLGHHHAQAGASERAAEWFELAARRARQSYANRDAERFYRLALAELARLPPGSAKLQLEQGRLQETLAELLIGTSRYEEARTALDAALAHTTSHQRVLRARRCRLLARTWERLHEHERALALLARAESELGTRPVDDGDDDGYWFEQVEIQIQATWHLYFLSRVAELGTLIDRVKPAIESRGTAHQRAQFFLAVLHKHLRRDRYQVGSDSLELARKALAAAEEASDPDDLALVRFHLAFALAFGGHEAEAEPIYRQALERVERVGDASLQARFLSYYTILHRRLGHVADTLELAQRALAIAEQHGFSDYSGVAHANLAWVAARQGGDIERPVADALAAWGRLPATYPYPLQWLARALLAARLTERGNAQQALEQWELLLDARQARLPEALQASIEAALAKRSRDGSVDATSLTAILELARLHRYL